MDGVDHLSWLRSRHSVRRFTTRAIDRAVMERLLHAATTAPSATNRQPWRFAVVTAPAARAAIVDAVRRRTAEIQEVIARGHHADELGGYGDFFFEPLESAQGIVVPQVREYPDMIAQLIASGGSDPAHHDTPASMPAELCATSAAVMCLLLQAHAEGLGACWMAGPMVARRDLHAILGIAAPWRLLGTIALGWPEARPESGPGRKPLDKIVVWHEGDT